jgi:protein ImuB
VEGKTVERLLVVWCPELLEEGEHGREARAFRGVVGALGTFAARVDPVRPGVCAVPTRGPARYFGGDGALAGLATGALSGRGRAGVGIADGLFAAVLAARAAVDGEPVIVPAGATPGFLARWPVTALDRPELADLLVRLGIRTLGGFAALPGREVLARFGTDVVVCQRVAAGTEGELPGFRLILPGARPGPPAAATTRQTGFWGDTADADNRASRAVAGVQELLHAEAAVRGRLQGGRGPAQRARLVPFTGPAADGEAPAGPWPGQVPAPAPAVVLDRPLPAQLADEAGRAVGVTGGGMATAAPARLSVDGGPWTAVAGWAGPWPSDERWWSARGRRRQARMQVVTAGGRAHLLTRERGGWWLEATYD